MEGLFLRIQKYLIKFQTCPDFLNLVANPLVKNTVINKLINYQNKPIKNFVSIKSMSINATAKTS